MLDKFCRYPQEIAEIRHFLHLACPMRMNWHAEKSRGIVRMGKKTMQYISTFASRFVAATSALALSLVLISGTVNVPQHSGTSAYVGVIA